MAVFCQNAPNNTHKTINNHMVYPLVTNKKNLKNIYRLFKNELQKKISKTLVLGFLTFIK